MTSPSSDSLKKQNSVSPTRVQMTEYSPNSSPCASTVTPQVEPIPCEFRQMVKPCLEALHKIQGGLKEITRQTDSTPRGNHGDVRQKTSPLLQSEPALKLRETTLMKTPLTKSPSPSPKEFLSFSIPLTGSASETKICPGNDSPMFMDDPCASDAQTPRTSILSKPEQSPASNGSPLIISSTDSLASFPNNPQTILDSPDCISGCSSPLEALVDNQSIKKPDLHQSSIPNPASLTTGESPSPSTPSTTSASEGNAFFHDHSRSILDGSCASDCISGSVSPVGTPLDVSISDASATKMQQSVSNRLHCGVIPAEGSCSQDTTTFTVETAGDTVPQMVSVSDMLPNGAVTTRLQDAVFEVEDLKPVDLGRCENSQQDASELAPAYTLDPITTKEFAPEKVNSNLMSFLRALLPSKIKTIAASVSFELQQRPYRCESSTRSCIRNLICSDPGGDGEKGPTALHNGNGGENGTKTEEATPLKETNESFENSERVMAGYVGEAGISVVSDADTLPSVQIEESLEETDKCCTNLGKEQGPGP